MPKVTDLTPLLKAISFAAQKHQGQKRKDDKTPYVAHPMRVATLMTQEFGVRDPDVLCTALLHDTIEDTTTDHDDLAREFGARVAGWVSLLTKDKRLPEEERERKYFDGLASAPVEVRLCKLGDTLDNLLDVKCLERAKQEKALGKAKQLVGMFEAGWPAEWAKAMERVKQAIAELEGSLGKCT